MNVDRHLHLSIAATVMQGSSLPAPLLEQEFVRMTEAAESYLKDGTWPKGFGKTYDREVQVNDPEARARIQDAAVEGFIERSRVKDPTRYGIDPSEAEVEPDGQPTRVVTASPEDDGGDIPDDLGE